MIFAASAGLAYFPESTGAVRPMVFPVIGPATFSNDYKAPRANGGPHHAIDIIAGKRRKLVSAVNGTITHVSYPEPSWGYSITITDSDGYRYRYIHINNDNPGTDDGKGGGMNAYAMDVKVGNKVIRGQHIGYVGDSGNAENTVPHLHFEMFNPSGDVTNPYLSLRAAKRIGKPVTPVKQGYELLPYDQFSGGAEIAAANFDGDPELEVLIGPGPGGGPRLIILDDDMETILNSFYVLDTSFRGGVNVAAGDVDGDGIDEIIIGAGPGGSPFVKAFDLSRNVYASFPAYASNFRGGVKVSVGEIDSFSPFEEIVTIPNERGEPLLKIFSASQELINDYHVLEEWWEGYYDVAAGEEFIKVSTGKNRRTSVRDGSINPPWW